MGVVMVMIRVTRSAQNSDNKRFTTSEMVKLHVSGEKKPVKAESVLQIIRWLCSHP